MTLPEGLRRAAAWIALGALALSIACLVVAMGQEAMPAWLRAAPPSFVFAIMLGASGLAAAAARIVPARGTRVALVVAVVLVAVPQVALVTIWAYGERA